MVISLPHSSLILHAPMPLLTVSFNLNMGIPLGRLPSFFISATALTFSVIPPFRPPSHRHNPDVLRGAISPPKARSSSPSTFLPHSEDTCVYRRSPRTMARWTAHVEHRDLLKSYPDATTINTTTIMMRPPKTQ